jgi:head-tail adaptor
MNIDASILAPDLSDRSDDPIKSAEQITADNERSERNVRLWSSYLPPECVNAMIRMGWDRST